MSFDYLDFERPIAELQQKIEELRRMGTDSEINISEEITRLEKKIIELTVAIFSNLNASQVVQLARHPKRPYTQDYIDRIFTDFVELKGDRSVSEGPAIVAGMARLDGIPVMVLGHQKGRKTKEKLYRNFGMPRPEEYRKALRIMKMAEKFGMPIITFIDTPGAYPGIGAEKHNQSEAIARNLFEMSNMRTPIICTVIGEGGSGGALALAVGDRLFMLEHSIYSTISPEGCASILWRSQDKTKEAAEAMRVTATDLRELGLNDKIIDEPLGGAHRDHDEIARRVKEVLVDTLNVLKNEPMEQLLEARYQRLRQYGQNQNS